MFGEALIFLLYMSIVNSTCPDGFHGAPNCSLVCPNSCINRLCHDTGDCQACRQGYFGSYCSYDCGNNCYACHSVNGHCIDCYSGFWGNNCENKCSENCHIAKCDQRDGICFSCAPSYWGIHCDKECHSNNCLNEHGEWKCNIHDGYCHGCQTGFWKKDCSVTCHRQCYKGCNQQTGYCETCNGLAFGANCEIPCNSNCKVKNGNVSEPLCNREGVCLNGCKTGSSGDDCDKPGTTGDINKTDDRHSKDDNENDSNSQTRKVYVLLMVGISFIVVSIVVGIALITVAVRAHRLRTATPDTSVPEHTGEINNDPDRLDTVSDGYFSIHSELHGEHGDHLNENFELESSSDYIHPQHAELNEAFTC